MTSKLQLVKRFEKKGKQAAADMINEVAFGRKMVKAKIFHAGKGLYEVRYKRKGGTMGIGTFYSKRLANKVVKNLKLSEKKRKSIPMQIKIYKGNVVYK